MDVEFKLILITLGLTLGFKNDRDSSLSYLDISMLTYAANVTIPSANRLGGCGSGVRAGHLLISSFDP